MSRTYSKQAREKARQVIREFREGSKQGRRQMKAAGREMFAEEIAEFWRWNDHSPRRARFNFS